MKHAVWFHHHIPNQLSGLSPMELLSKTKANHCDLLHTHVWGCPVYYLDPKLQDGQKIPKWNHQSCLGLFLGFSDIHSSLVANVQRFSTKYALQQYHLVFEDLIKTLFSTGNDVLFDDIYNYLFNSDCNIYSYDDIFITDDPLVYHLPPLEEVWLIEPDHWVHCCKVEENFCLAEGCEQVKWINKALDGPSDALPNLSAKSDGDSESSDHPPLVFYRGRKWCCSTQ